MRSPCVVTERRRCRLDGQRDRARLPPRDRCGPGQSCERPLLNLDQRVAARWARRRGLA